MSLLKPCLSEKYNGLIWRMEIDPLSKMLFAEVRNEADRQVSFTAISLADCRVNFKDLQTDEKWLCGLEAAYDGVLLLHNYLAPSGPAHQGIIAVDGQSGAILWSNYLYALDYLSVNGPVVFDSRLQPRRLQLIDVRSGQLLRAHNPSTDKELPNQVVLPAMLNANELTFTLPAEPFGNIVHYLQHNNYRIVSLHTPVGNKLMQKLFVMVNDGVIFEDLLNEDIQKIQPEAFVLHGNRMVYLKNKSEISVINL